MSTVLVAISIVAQTAAAGLAIRLNVLYGRRVAWTLIAVAMVVMTGPRIATLLDLVSGDGSASLLLDGSGRVPDASTWLTCLASILLMSGVILIHPLFQAIAEAELRLRDENVRLGDTVRQSESELRLARRIQRQLLPRSAPRIEGFDVSGISIPAHFVGGDYFDYFALPSGEIAFVVADVSGHGVGAAIQMSQVYTMLHIVSQTTSEPSEMLNVANAQFIKTATDGQFVTVFLVCLEPNTRRLRYVGAGHEAWIIRNDCSHDRLQSTGMAIGWFPDTEFSTQSHTLRPGDILLLLTDGIVEAHDHFAAMFGRKRAISYVVEHHHQSAAEIAQGLCREARRFAGDSYDDDMTAVVLKVDDDSLVSDDGIAESADRVKRSTDRKPPRAETRG